MENMDNLNADNYNNTRDLKYVESRLAEMGVIDTFGTKKEIKELPNILNAGENLLYITSGFLDGNTWLISCTDKRLLFIDKGMIFGVKQREIPLNKVNSVMYTTGILMGTLTIMDGSTGIKIENILNEGVKKMSSTINNAIEELKNNTSHNLGDISKNSKKSNTLIDDLEKLAELKNKKIITEEEFQIAKSKLFNNL